MNNFKEKITFKLINFLDTKLGGHKTIGNLTIFGHNAMHWGCQYWTKKWGYICFRLPLPYNLRWMPLHLYFSPNATPWAATFMIGRRFTKTEKLCSKLRKIKLGHNFKYDSETEDYNYKVLRQINNLR